MYEKNQVLFSNLFIVRKKKRKGGFPLVLREDVSLDLDLSVVSLKA